MGAPARPRDEAERSTPAALLRDAVEGDPADGGLAGDAEVLRALVAAEIRGVGRIVYSSNACFLLELDANDPGGTRPLRAVYKPTRGERPLWDFPRHTLALREVATYLVDAALGFGLVPPTVVRDGPLGAGSVQLFVDVIGRELTGAEEAALRPSLATMAALDVLVNNADRKSAHLLVCDGPRLRGIDHGLSFLPYPRQRTVLLGLGGSPLPDEVATRIATLDADTDARSALRDRLRRLLSDDEVEAFTHRLRELAREPVYPVLDPWDGRPFEWW